MEIETLIKKIIGCCIEVHKELGPGFLEGIYHQSLSIRFEEEGIKYEHEKQIPVYYHQKLVGTHILDFLIENEVVLEIKTVEDMHKKYYAQVRSYLKAVDKDIGLLVNFADFKLDVRRVEKNRAKE
ncbi:MAG: GxxExxY protein [bacterium]|nr:GxxExxY protein [bacterium]